MKVSTKGRYGLRILLDIALHQEQGVVTLRDISRRQAISHKYLWQVINPLKAAGLLHAIRGARGGYTLARPPETISLRDVVNVLEGPISMVACVKTPDSCERSDSCVARQAWSEVEEKLSSTMGGITLKDLVQRHSMQENLRTPDYVI
jgi:Rrf2 family protein